MDTIHVEKIVYGTRKQYALEIIICSSCGVKLEYWIQIPPHMSDEAWQDTINGTDRFGHGHSIMLNENDCFEIVCEDINHSSFTNYIPRHMIATQLARVLGLLPPSDYIK